jgi:hypothetical protein
MAISIVAASWRDGGCDDVHGDGSMLVQTLEEIRRVGSRPPQEGENSFRKCTVTFMLTVSLLRLVEGVAKDGRSLLTSDAGRCPAHLSIGGLGFATRFCHPNNRFAC